MDIAAAPDLEAASLMALEILADVVPTESAAVLLVDLDRNALRFSAATGPYADRARTLLVPLGVGIAGFAVSTGRSIIVQDAETDPRRFAEADQTTGYTTRSMLAAALVDADGRVLGCIELINAPEPFLDWHLDAACSIASALAEAVSIRGGASPLS
jgi:GAF domain-containing protein